MYRVTTIVTLVASLATLWAVGSPPSFATTPLPVSIGMTEEANGDQSFSAGNYKDAAKQYGLALRKLGINVEWFKDVGKGTYSYPKNPFRTAVMMRKWARATQFLGDTQYAATRKLPKMTLVQALAASSSATNLLESLREQVSLVEESRARQISEELRQAYDIQVEISFLLSWTPKFMMHAFEASNRARARSIVDAVWLRMMLPKAKRVEYEFAQRHQSLLIQIGELSRTLSDERAETVPRTNVTADLARRLKHLQAQLNVIGVAS